VLLFLVPQQQHLEAHKPAHQVVPRLHPDQQLDLHDLVEAVAVPYSAQCAADAAVVPVAAQLHPDHASLRYEVPLWA
jgi:hypothetical protein